MSTTDLIALLALIIAVYGAIVSTYIVFREAINDRRRIRVTSTISFTAAKGDISSELVSVSAVNVGHRPIEIVSAGIFLSDGSAFWFTRNAGGPMPFPKKLEDGDRVVVYTTLFDIKKPLEKLNGKVLYTKAFVMDNEDKKYTTKLPKIVRQRGLVKKQFILF